MRPRHFRLFFTCFLLFAALLVFGLSVLIAENLGVDYLFTEPLFMKIAGGSIAASGAIALLVLWIGMLRDAITRKDLNFRTIWLFALTLFSGPAALIYFFCIYWTTESGTAPAVAQP